MYTGLIVAYKAGSLYIYVKRLDFIMNSSSVATITKIFVSINSYILIL